jgi:hypothetical protein
MANEEKRREERREENARCRWTMEGVINDCQSKRSGHTVSE